MRIPFHLLQRSGRKKIQLPERTFSQRKTDSTLVKTLGRAFRWKQMLESGGTPPSLNGQRGETTAPSYLTRVLRLTLLTPHIVEAILAKQQESGTMLVGLMAPFPLEWNEPRRNSPDHSMPCQSGSCGSLGHTSPKP